MQTPQAKGENAYHIMEPTKQRLQASSLCRFSFLLVVFSDSFPNFTRTYLFTDLQSPEKVLTVSIETVSTKSKKRKHLTQAMKKKAVQTSKLNNNKCTKVPFQEPLFKQVLTFVANNNAFYPSPFSFFHFAIIVSEL